MNINKFVSDEIKNPSKVIIGLIVVFSFIIAISFYRAPCFPERVASHWDAQGQVNGYLDKFWGLFLMPIISLIMALMFLIIPRIDPMKENVDKFRKYYDGFIVVIMLFLFYTYLLTLAWNIGLKFGMVQFLLPAFSVLFYAAGVLVEKSRRNWFIGIKTPWTLSSEVVWDKTHRLGGKLFKASSLISLLGIVLPQYALVFVMAPALFTAFFTIIYSYFIYQGEKRQNNA